jgi:putative transposase
VSVHLVWTIFGQPDPASVRDRHAQVAAALEAKFPAAAAHLDDAREDILAFPARCGGRSGATTHYLNKEIWRRTDVVEALAQLPNRLCQVGRSGYFAHNLTA